MPATLFEKVWNAHLVQAESADTPAVLYVDLHLIHEITSPQAFATLAARGIDVRRPERTVATMDHSIPTLRSPGRDPEMPPDAATQVERLRENCRRHGIRLLDMDDRRQGIVHVIGPELGLTQPGMTIVCGDSHTSTHGAFGALAFGIGTTEVTHVLATQSLLQRRPRTLGIQIDGELAPGITAKDVILAVLARVGVDGGTGHVVEYRGRTVRTMDMEQRMTICNMSIEMGARAGMVAPDETTYAWLEGRPMAPTGSDWERALERFQALPSDPDAEYDRFVQLDASQLEPMVTWGTNPGTAIGIKERIPGGGQGSEASRALRYMDLEAGEPILGRRIDWAFIGSCTNARISDLRAAAAILRGRKIASHVRALVVPGSTAVKEQAEAEGLDRVFREAGAEWRQAGCSMCVAINRDRAGPGQYVVSTSNRNFEGRQGTGARTFLASPITAAASAVAGEIADPRDYLQ